MQERESVEVIEGREVKKIVCEHRDDTCEIYTDIRHVPAEWREELWNIYESSMHIEDAVQEQSCYTRDAFMEAMNDEDYWKVIMLVNDVPMGMIIATNNLEKMKVAYVNPDFIKKRFKKEVEEGRFWYITCLCVSPKLQHLGFIKPMVSVSLKSIRELGYIFGGDASDARLFLIDFIKKMGEDVGVPLEIKKLGSQEYITFRKSLT
jgi:hypothetical protein